MVVTQMKSEERRSERNVEKRDDKTLEKKINYRFKDQSLLRCALTHKSFSNESKQSFANNEKLEFLGDAVLDLVLGDYLMQRFPNDNEGSLSKKRASIVNEEALSKIAISIDLSHYLLLGRGEISQGGSLKPRLLASSFEAILGAIYRDSNFETVAEIIKVLFEPMIAAIPEKEAYELDYKTRLQEVVQERFFKTPQYSLIEEKGPSHDRIFKVQVRVSDEYQYEGEGRTKKSSEQAAAKAALTFLLAHPEIKLEKKKKD